MLNTKKIIIFLTSLSNSANRKRRIELINDYCKQNKFTTIRIIENKNLSDLTNLRKLIDEMKNEPKETFTVLIEDKIINDPNNIVLISSLGTLHLLGLIHTEIYKKSYREVKLYGKMKNDFLSIADFCLYYTLECHKKQK